MKGLTLFLVMVSFYGLIGCAPHRNELLFSSPLVSYDKSSAPEAPLKRGKFFQIKWCPSEKSRLPEGKPPAGVDEIIAKAHEEQKSDYFIDATFYTDYSYNQLGSCLAMRGYTAI